MKHHSAFLTGLLSALCLLSSGCNSSKEDNRLRFRGFTIGTPADSIIYVMGSEPWKRSESTLNYRYGTYEGLKPEVLTFNLAAGRLVSADFYLSKPNPELYKKLHGLFTERYGKPEKDSVNLAAWQDDEAVLTILGEESLLVSFVRKDLVHQ